MRIAILTNAYPPQARGGAGRIAASQVELLQAEGHDVRVWVASLEWTQFPFWKRVFFHLRDLAWVHPAAREICAWGPDVLLTHNVTGVGFRTPGSIQRHQIRWVHLLHDVQLFEPLGLLRDETAITYFQRLTTIVRQRVFGVPDVVLSPTKWLLQAHVRRGWFQKSQTTIIPNPAPKRSGSLVKEWNTLLRVLFVGRMSAEKGAGIVQVLMRTATRPIEWRLIGPGLALGERTAEEIQAEMQAADVLLVPSCVVENQPTVLLEAFACGLPVIARAIGGIPETVGDAGVLVSSDRTEDWWNAFTVLLAKPRSVWSERSSNRFERHVPERVVEALLDVLRSNKKI